MNKRSFNALRKVAGDIQEAAPVSRFMRNYGPSPMDIHMPQQRTQTPPRFSHALSPQHAPISRDMPEPDAGFYPHAPTPAGYDESPAARFSDIFTQRYPVSTYRQMLDEYRNMGQRAFSGARDTGAEIVSGYRDDAQRALRGATEEAARIVAENEDAIQQHVQDNYSAEAVRERAAGALGLDSDATAEEVGGAAVRKGLDWLNRRFGR